MARRRLGVCLLLAAALHIGLLVSVDAPFRSLPAPRAALDLSLVVVPPRRVASGGTASVEVTPAESPTAAPRPARSSPLAERPAIEPEPPFFRPPPARQPPPKSPFAGKSPTQLAHALVAARREAPPPSAAHRVLRLTDAPARSDFVYYLEAWHRQVERIGKLNYPGEARRRNLTGKLRLLVVIRADGELADTRLVESSGHAVLDEAALRIVHLAAPYAPFPPRIAAQADILEIERTWRFQGDGDALLQP